MLRSLENMLGYQIAARNGYIGTLEDFFYLDDSWTIRYLIIAAGGWLNRKQVLLSTSIVQEISDAAREVRVGLTKEQVYSSPDIDTDKPVTRQKELLLAEHYGWEHNWKPEQPLGSDLQPVRMEIEGHLEGSNPHLRSFRELTTYSTAENESIGYVVDAIANDLGWGIPSIVVSKSRDVAIDAVLVPAGRVRNIDWTNRTIQFDLEDGAHKAFPPFVPHAPVNQRRIVKVFDYCGRLQHSSLIPECEQRS
jgi:hypothetical protein